nr:CP19k-like protein 11 [Chthamalus malayensis]
MERRKLWNRKTGNYVFDNKKSVEPISNLAPSGNRRRPKSKPTCNVSTLSKLGQRGHTSGGGAVSGTTSSQGSGSIACVFRGPGLSIDAREAARSGVAGSAASNGHGAFGQTAGANSGVAFVPGLASVTSGTGGDGTTLGGAAIAQEAGAHAGAKIGSQIDLHLRKVDIGQAAQAAGTSSSNHRGSGNGDSKINVKQQSETKVKIKGPLAG